MDSGAAVGVGGWYGVLNWGRDGVPFVGEYGGRNSDCVGEML